MRRLTLLTSRAGSTAVIRKYGPILNMLRLKLRDSRPNVLVKCDGAGFIVPYFRKENKKSVCTLPRPRVFCTSTLLVQ